MKKIGLFVLGSFLVLALDAGRAHAAASTILVTVDSVSRDLQQENVLHLTGILQGESTVKTFSIFFAAISGNDNVAPWVTQSCERFAQMMMARPGRYLLDLGTWGYDLSGNPSWAETCRLKRAP